MQDVREAGRVGQAEEAGGGVEEPGAGPGLQRRGVVKDHGDCPAALLSQTAHCFVLPVDVLVDGVGEAHGAGQVRGHRPGQPDHDGDQPQVKQVAGDGNRVTDAGHAVRAVGLQEPEQPVLEPEDMGGNRGLGAGVVVVQALAACRLIAMVVVLAGCWGDGPTLSGVQECTGPADEASAGTCEVGRGAAGRAVGGEQALVKGAGEDERDSPCLLPWSAVALLDGAAVSGQAGGAIPGGGGEHPAAQPGDPRAWRSHSPGCRGGDCSSRMVRSSGG